jgi:hypothetical protein
MLDNAEYHAGSEGQVGAVCQPRHPPRLDGGGGAGTLVWSSERHGAQGINCPLRRVSEASMPAAPCGTELSHTAQAPSATEARAVARPLIAHHQGRSRPRSVPPVRSSPSSAPCPHPRVESRRPARFARYARGAWTSAARPGRAGAASGSGPGLACVPGARPWRPPAGRRDGGRCRAGCRPPAPRHGGRRSPAARGGTQRG